MTRDVGGASRLFLKTLFEDGVPAGLTDGQLLERFATGRGEAAELAFAILVERHGPMVLRAARGILRDDHEAMDAFQATFLILVRKGRSLWVRDSLGPWLHRVACRAAVRARAEASRRRALERGLADGDAPPGRRRRSGRAGGGRARGAGPPAGPLPRAHRALRSGRPHLRRGGPPPGLPDRHDRQSSGQGPGAIAGPVGPSRPGPGSRDTVVGAVDGVAGSGNARRRC